MLVLSRGIGECVLVGDDVEIRPVALRCGEESLSLAHVRLGFRAPRDVTILRSEVALRDSRSGEGGGGPHLARKQMPGYPTEITEATVRLRIALPPGRIVHHHKQSSIHLGSGRVVESFRSSASTGANDASSHQPAIVEIECGKDDSILLGNVTLVVVDVRRFVKTAVAGSPRL
jgi:carbon storage regulator CsrA